MESIAQFELRAAPYVAAFNAFCQKHSLASLGLADHLCYKCDSSPTFEAMRRLFEGDSRFTYQSIVAGRRIAFIGLSRPFETAVGKIHYLELSDVKPAKPQASHYDHIEVVPKTISYEDLVGRLKAAGENVIEEIRPHHSTHDVDIGNGFFFRITREFLLGKIKREEMM